MASGSSKKIVRYENLSCPLLDSLMELDYLLNVLKPVPDVPVLAAQLLILLDLERSAWPILTFYRTTGAKFKTEWVERQGNRDQM